MKTIYVPVTRYDVAGVHLQSMTDTGVPTVTETVSAKPTTAVKAEMSGRGESDQIASSTPRPKRVAFVKEAPLTSQNDQRARTRSTERFDTDNRKRKSCTICNGPHTNLVYCPQLPMFVPVGNSSKAIPRGLCKVCLFAGFTE